MSVDTVAEQAGGAVAGGPASSVSGTAIHPELLQSRRRRRRFIALTLALVLAAIVMASLVFGAPSVAASGGCGGG